MRSEKLLEHHNQTFFVRSNLLQKHTRRQTQVILALVLSDLVNGARVGPEPSLESLSCIFFALFDTIEEEVF